MSVCVQVLIIRHHRSAAEKIIGEIIVSELEDVDPETLIFQGINNQDQCDKWDI